MHIQEAFQKAVEDGYHVGSFDGVETFYSGSNSEYSAWTRTDNESSFMIKVEETLLDPAFWWCLCGEKNGRKIALKMVEHLFDGGSIESFFKEYVPPRRAKKSHLTTWLQKKPWHHCVRIFPAPGCMN